MLNKCSTNSRKTHDIPIDTLYDYFKTINANTNVDMHDEIEGININELCENPLYDNILNGVISEIPETITKLKKKKKLQGKMVFLMMVFFPFVNPNIFQII